MRDGYAIRYSDIDSSSNKLSTFVIKSNIYTDTNVESNESNKKIESIKEEIDTEFDKKLEELINIRNESLDLTDSEIEFIKRQKRVQKEIEESKSKVERKRNILSLN